MYRKLTKIDAQFSCLHCSEPYNIFRIKLFRNCFVFRRIIEIRQLITHMENQNLSKISRSGVRTLNLCVGKLPDQIYALITSIAELKIYRINVPCARTIILQRPSCASQTFARIRIKSSSIK